MKQILFLNYGSSKNRKFFPQTFDNSLWRGQEVIDNPQFRKSICFTDEQFSQWFDPVDLSATEETIPTFYLIKIMKVSFNTEDALYQFFDKSHLPSGITLTDEEWDEF